MRKHGWQLPYHPLQVVAVAVFMALGFAFYVFFAPFVGKKVFQYVVIGLYTPLITVAFSLYIWCAAADPADSGVFRSKKYLKIPDNGKHARPKESKLGGESTSSIHEANAAAIGEKSLDKDVNATVDDPSRETEKKNASCQFSSCFVGLLACFPCALMCNCSSRRDNTSDQQMSEDGMFYCSLCEVEVFKYSKHCRVCDKCVDSFDHHCRWLNNCIGKKNYRQFFTLMVSSLLLVYTWFVHLGLEIAAYSTMVDWNSCVDLLFSRAEAILCRHYLEVGEQFLFSTLCYCGGSVHPFGYGCNPTPCSAFLLSHSPHKEGNQHI